MHCSANNGDRQPGAGVLDQAACGEIIGAIHHKGTPKEQLFRIGPIDETELGLPMRSLCSCPHTLDGYMHLRATKISRGVEQLPGEIAQLHRITVYDRDLRCAQLTQQREQCTANGTCPDHGDVWNLLVEDRCCGAKHAHKLRSTYTDNDQLCMRRMPRTECAPYSVNVQVTSKVPATAFSLPSISLRSTVSKLALICLVSALNAVIVKVPGWPAMPT